MAATGAPSTVDAAARYRHRDHDRRQQRVRADHRRGDLGVHELQGVRRDLPGQHRDPRQDPRHAPLPVADGERLPGRAGQRLPGMENQRNPWGMNQGERADWAKGLTTSRSSTPASRARPSTSTGSAAPAPSTTRTRRSPSRWRKLLQRAGIAVAILGPAEMCTGDSARRLGNEYLFQMLAMPNIEMLNGMGVKKIITQCPHCFNTLQERVPAVRRQLRGGPPQHSCSSS